MLIEGLSSTGAGAGRDSQTLARVLGSRKRERTVDIRGLGPVAVAIESVSLEPQAADGEIFAIECDGQVGALCVDRLFSATLLASFLGHGMPAIPRPRSPSERGVLGGILLPLLAALGDGAPVRMSLGLAPPKIAPGMVSLNMSVRAPGGTGWCAWTLPLSAVAAAVGKDGGAPPGLEGDTLATVVTLELARTKLERPVCASVVAGDAVVFDGYAFPRADAPWKLLARVGVRAAEGLLAPDGSLQKTGMFLSQEEIDAMSTTRNPARESPLDIHTETGSVLAEAPVEVVAEIGRITIRGDELAGFIKGSVLAVGARRAGPVDLRIGGRLWAEGELVNVDDELGVRLTKVLR